MDGVDRRTQDPTGDDEPIGRLPDDVVERLRDRDAGDSPSRIEQVDDAIADALGDDPGDEPT